MNELKTEKLFLTSKEACLYLGINRKLFDSLRRSGRIRSSKIGKQYYFLISELNSFANNSIGKEISKDGLIIGDSYYH